MQLESIEDVQMEIPPKYMWQSINNSVKIKIFYPFNL